MLGKGLESLIPPNKGSGSPAGQSSPHNNPAPQGQSSPLQPGMSQPISHAPAVASQKAIPATSEPSWAPSHAHVPATPPADLPVALQPEEELLPGPQEENLLRPMILEEAELQPARTLPVKEAAPIQDQISATVSRPGTMAYAAARKPNKEREESIFYLETAKIKPNEHQPRKYFDEDAIHDLANSIREFGVLQPIVVTKKEKEVPTGTEVEYELIAGERRLMAAKSLGLERIPAIIRHIDLERERLELAIIENLQRENLNGIEMARSFAQLQDEFRLTQREIAARLGKSRETVANTLRLLDLPTYIQEAIQKRAISESHGILLLGVEDPAMQQALFHDLVNQKMTIRELRHRARVLAPKKERATLPGIQPEIKMFEERLASELGAPVSIQQKGESGKITIDFFSKEELEAIMRRLGGNEE